MLELFPFFIVIFAAVFFSAAFNRLHLPWVVALILGGILIGPEILGIFEPNETTTLLSEIGLVFLMFMAGLETKFGTIRKEARVSFGIAGANGIIPFIVGVGIALLFGLPPIAAALLGIIFISSSIGVVIPSLEASGVLHTRLGGMIISTTMIQDVASLLLLSILLQSVSPITTLPLPLFYGFLLLVIILLRYSIPKVRIWFREHRFTENDLFQQELRSIFVILIGTVILFELLGLHPIIGGFFAGFVLADTITSDVLREKIRTVSYGLFIPFFFITVGSNTDISVFADSSEALFITIAIIGGSIGSKFLSGYWGAKRYGFNKRESALLAVTSMPQLSTTLAVVITGFELGLLTSELVTAMIALSVVTTFVTPLLISAVSKSRDIETKHVMEGKYSLVTEGQVTS